MSVLDVFELLAHKITRRKPKFKIPPLLGQWYWLEIKIDTRDFSKLISTVGGGINELGYSRMDLSYPFYMAKILMPYRPFVLAYDEALVELYLDAKKRPKLLESTSNLLFPIRSADGTLFVISQQDLFSEEKTHLAITRICLILKEFQLNEQFTVEPYINYNGRRRKKLSKELKRGMGAKVHASIPVKDKYFWDILELSADGKRRKDIQRVLQFKTMNILDDHKKKCVRTLNEHFETSFKGLKMASNFLRDHSVV